MPTSIGTFCNASRSHLAVKKTYQHIWISDDILADTFAAFAHSHKRHGSNVPGPLEARRRASKRRATQLAHTPATGYNPESFGLFDTQSQQGWWQRGQYAPEQKGAVWRWPFAIPNVRSAPPPPPPQPTTQYIENEAFGAGSKELYMNNLLRKNLQDIRTHAELIDLLPSLEISLRHNPAFAATITETILAQGWACEEVAEYLLDPRTNPPGTTNHLAVLELWKKHPEIVKQLLDHSIFGKAAHLGMLSVDEIQRIVVCIPDVDESVFPEHLDWASFCSQLLDATESSKVLRLGDLGDSFIRSWLDGMPLRSFSPSVPELLWRLQKYMNASDEDALQAVLYTSISMANMATVRYLQSLVEFLLSHPQESTRSLILRLTSSLATEIEGNSHEMSFSMRRTDTLFRRKLEGLDDAVESSAEGRHQRTSRQRLQNHPATFYTRYSPTAAQVVSTPSTEPEVPSIPVTQFEQATKLDLWYSLLARLGASRRFWMTQISLEEFARSPPDGANAQQHSLAALWSIMAISARTNDAVTLNTLNNFVAEEIHRNFSSFTEDNPPDVLANIHRAIQSSPLPFKNKLLRRISTLSSRFLDVKQNYWDLGQHLESLCDAQILPIQNELMYQSMKHHFPAKLTEAAESLNGDLKKFEETCVNIIKHTQGSISIVFRLLQHNEELKLALRQAATSMRSAPNQWELHQKHSPKMLGGYSYVELVQMMHTIAQELAKSENLSPRNALSKVGWIRQFLMDCNVPDRPPIGRALWHAGVVRYQGARLEPCYEIIRWLHSKILRLESKAVANDLVRKAGHTQIPDLKHGPRVDLVALCKEFPIDESTAEGDSKITQSDVDVTASVDAPVLKYYFPHERQAMVDRDTTTDTHRTSATLFSPLNAPRTQSRTTESVVRWVVPATPDKNAVTGSDTSRERLP